MLLSAESRRGAGQGEHAALGRTARPGPAGQRRAVRGKRLGPPGESTGTGPVFPGALGSGVAWHKQGGQAERPGEPCPGRQRRRGHLGAWRGGCRFGEGPGDALSDSLSLMGCPGDALGLGLGGGGLMMGLQDVPLGAVLVFLGGERRRAAQAPEAGVPKPGGHPLVWWL